MLRIRFFTVAAATLFMASIVGAGGANAQSAGTDQSTAPLSLMHLFSQPAAAAAPEPAAAPAPVQATTTRPRRVASRRHRAAARNTAQQPRSRPLRPPIRRRAMLPPMSGSRPAHLQQARIRSCGGCQLRTARCRFTTQRARDRRSDGANRRGQSSQRDRSRRCQCAARAVTEHAARGRRLAAERPRRHDQRHGQPSRAN